MFIWRTHCSWLGLITLIFFVMIPLAACGGGNSSPTPSSTSVSVIDNDFSPKELHISPGQTVTWTNNGQASHTVTADDLGFTSGVLTAGKTYTYTFTKAGRYAYYCQFHGGAGGGGMSGVIFVGSSSDTATGALSIASLPSHEGRATIPTAVLMVPEQFATIQAAVDHAMPGDLISIGPSPGSDGTYHEAVQVSKKHPDITIRGRDRNTVILDGNYDSKLGNGVEVFADDVVIENMTARHYISNGFYWTGVTGFRGSYLTAYGNGDYGIYAYNSTMGQFDHDFAAGQPDSGFYIGDCHPCHAEINHVISEDNALGYSGTNAGGDLTIENSIWRDNMAGIAPNTLDSEPNPPQDGATITNNLVENNNNYHAPAKVLEYPSIGNGIIIGGGNNNVITNNRVSGHIYYGILIVPNIDTNFWEPSGNTVMNNMVSSSGVADLALSALSAANNCFSDNKVVRTSPPFLQFTHACGSLFAHAGAGDPSVSLVLLDHFLQANQHRFTAQDWKTASTPTDATTQTAMPAPTSNPLPITDLPHRIFTDKGGTLIDMTPAATSITPSITLGGLGLANPFFEVILGFYLYYLPLALYGAWLSIITWDIVRRSEMKDGRRIGWLAIVYLIPVLGPLAYFFFGRSEISRATRFALALGAPIVYLLVSVVLLLFVS